MSSGRFITPKPFNETIRDYGPGSEDKRRLKQELKRQAENPVEIPMIIGGREVRSGKTGWIACPHDHAKVLGAYHLWSSDAVGRAIRAAAGAKSAWQRLPWEDRAAVFLKAADLLAGPHRYEMNAATMLGQSRAQGVADGCFGALGISGLQLIAIQRH